MTLHALRRGAVKLAALLLATGWPAVSQACPTCLAAADSEQVAGLRMAVLGLLAVVGAVIGGLGMFFIQMVRRNRPGPTVHENATAPMPDRPVTREEVEV